MKFIDGYIQVLYLKILYPHNSESMSHMNVFNLKYGGLFKYAHLDGKQKYLKRFLIKNAYLYLAFCQICA